jgi:hypothetical protein
MFNMPVAPDVVVAQMFKGRFPKAVENTIGAIAVGGVCGIYKIGGTHMEDVLSGFGGMDVGSKVVSYAKGLRKVEINQLNWLLASRVKARCGQNGSFYSER